jgi:mercuric ion transport protein
VALASGNVFERRLAAWELSTQTGGRMSKALLKVGIAGTIIAALCCFTPILVVLLGAVGLAAALGWLDLVLLPALIAFLLLTGYALWQRARSS